MTRYLVLAFFAISGGSRAQQNTNKPVLSAPPRYAPADPSAAPVSTAPTFVDTIPGTPATPPPDNQTGTTPVYGTLPGMPENPTLPTRPAANGQTPAGTAPAATAIPPAAAPAGAAAPAAASSLPTLPSAAEQATEVSASYKIGPTDSIAVTVWKQPNFSGAYLVRPDGIITVPLIGDVPAAGMTPAQLSADLANRLKKYVNDPLVTVIVQAVNSKRIFLVGEVARIGPLPMTPDMTPLEAIATAGGLTPYGSAKHIYILRKVNGKEQRIPFNYKKAVKDGDMQGVELHPGDTIVVP